MDWNLDTLKVLVFPQAPVPDAAELWHSIAKRFPDNAQKTGLPLPLLSTASGTWNDYTLNVIMQPGRIEVSLTAIDQDPTGPTPIPGIPSADIEPVYKLGKEILSGLYADRPSVRFGVASQFIQDVADESEGVAIVSKELGGIFPKDSDSVLFQLNVKKDFDDTTVINRLCKWGVQRLATVGIGVDGTGRVVGVPPTEPKFRAYFHLDMNNRPLSEPISGEEARKLVARLWDEEEALRKGGRGAL